MLFVYFLAVLTFSSLLVWRHSLFYVQDDLFQANLPITPEIVQTQLWRYKIIAVIKRQQQINI